MAQESRLYRFCFSGWRRACCLAATFLYACVVLGGEAFAGEARSDWQSEWVMTLVKKELAGAPLRHDAREQKLRDLGVSAVNRSLMKGDRPC